MSKARVLALLRQAGSAKAMHNKRRRAQYDLGREGFVIYEIGERFRIDFGSTDSGLSVAERDDLLKRVKEVFEREGCDVYCEGAVLVLTPVRQG